MFEKVMNSIKEFLENTPDDIYEFSILLEDALVDEQQPEATKVLADEVPDICASAEPGMKKEEIEAFKCALRKEYEKALRAVM